MSKVVVGQSGGYAATHVGEKNSVAICSKTRLLLHAREQLNYHLVIFCDNLYSKVRLPFGADTMSRLQDWENLGWISSISAVLRLHAVCYCAFDGS
jgi:hypothetical protein